MPFIDKAGGTIVATTVSSILPRIFHWVFLVLAVLCALGAAAIAVAILVDPHLPKDTHFGPLTINFGGQPGTVMLRSQGSDSNLTLTALRGSIVVLIAKAGGLLEVVKHYGLPVVFINTLFLAIVFDLLRRLFRNVGRGDSFTRETVRLVQILGGSLLLFSLVLAIAESWFMQAAYGYLAANATVTISGTALHLPSLHPHMMPHVGGFPFASPIFDSGLLVLALAEVFRQGLVLKDEADLTV